jgi:dTDP-4-dehydrorhamnose 3,5-epimerase
MDDCTSAFRSLLGVPHDATTFPIITPMAVSATGVDGLMIVTTKQVEDERGTVREFYRQSSWLDAGLPDLGLWLQINVTETKEGAIRGLHGEAMHKLVSVAYGEVFGAYVDVRPDSSTYRAVETVRLVPGTQVLVPPGVCNGFQSAAPGPTQYLYAFDTEWAPGMPGQHVNPLDPALGINWPLAVDSEDRLQISAKDAQAPMLHELTAR